MEDQLTYPSLVVKLTGNIHPSDSQVNAITSTLHFARTCLNCMSPDRSRQVADLQMYPAVSYVQRRITNEGRTTNIFSPPNCISAYISDRRTCEKLSQT